MDSEQVIPIVMSSLNNFGAFVALVVTTVVVFVLWRRKEGGASGAFLLMLARTGVWLFTLSILVFNIIQSELDFELHRYLILGLRGLLVLSTLVTIPAFLLIKTKEA